MTANGDTYEIWLDANRYHYRTDGFAVLMLEGMNHSYPRRVQSAAIKAALKAIVELHGKLEAERQLRSEVMKNLLTTDCMRKAHRKIAEMESEQVPVAWIRERAIDKPEHKGKIWRDISYPVKPEPAAVDGVYHDVIIPLYDRPQKPVVLPKSHYICGCADRYMSEKEVKAAIEAAGGIVSFSDERLMQDMSDVVKDGK